MMMEIKWIVKLIGPFWNGQTISIWIVDWVYQVDWMHWELFLEMLVSFSKNRWFFSDMLYNLSYLVLSDWFPLKCWSPSFLLEFLKFWWCVGCIFSSCLDLELTVNLIVVPDQSWGFSRDSIQNLFSLSGNSCPKFCLEKKFYRTGKISRKNQKIVYPGIILKIWVDHPKMRIVHFSENGLIFFLGC